MKNETLFEVVTLSEVLRRERDEKEKLMNENQKLVMQNIYLRDRLKEMERGVETLTNFNIKLVKRWG